MNITLKDKFQKFIKLDINSQINKIQKIQDRYQKLNSKLLCLFKNYSSNIDTGNLSKRYSNEVLNFFNETAETYSLLNNSLTILNTLLKNLKQFSKENQYLTDDFIKKYNIENSFIVIFNNLNIIQEFLQKKYKLVKIDTTALSNPLLVPSWFKENTLIISEKENKIILPYSLEEIKQYISENNQLDLKIEDVINSCYTMPLSNFKNPIKSRFIEGFKLIRERENGSFKSALDLGLELAFKFKLHPAIIAACKNLNILDIYLACLDYNELSDFKYFNIIFEIPPVLVTDNII